MISQVSVYQATTFPIILMTILLPILLITIPLILTIIPQIIHPLLLFYLQPLIPDALPIIVTVFTIHLLILIPIMICQEG